IGMFKHYESEQEHKWRLLEKVKPIQAQTGPVRSRGWGSRRGGSFVYRLKNATVYIPLNTMWIKFRSEAGTNSINDPSLSALYLRIRSVALLEPALQQARNVLMPTHKG